MSTGLEFGVLGVVAALLITVLVVVLRQSRRSAAAKLDGDTQRLAEERRQLKEEADSLRAEQDRFRVEQERREQRMHDREDRLHAEQRDLADRARALDELAADLESRRAEVTGLDAERTRALERVAGLSADEAKEELVAGVVHDAKRAAAVRAREIERAAEQQAEDRARTIVVGAIQRLAAEQTAESVVTVVQLKADDMKGRIIGREGRNIRAFETVTGVNLIIDDTPEAVLLSCFDPVRREVGRLTLTHLLEDGRIHPHRIEEVYERSRREVEELIERAGQDAVVEMGITDLHPKLVTLLGRLRYRTSYGQNVLGHLVECGNLAAMMAAELGLDVALCRRSAFLHDVGKALTHEVDGSHALLGADLARKYGESSDVVHAIEAHHNEVAPNTAEAVLTQAADAISGGRPGARRESLEAYVKRLGRLEQIAAAQSGVAKAFAMQAGRELRVMVLPEEVDDIQAQVIARDVAKQVEEELTYPGQIRVTVVRESRAVEHAR